MKRSFFLLCAVLFVLGSLLPLAGYRLTKTVLGPSAPASSAAAPEPETPDAASLPPSDRDSETFLIADQSDGAVVSVPRRDYLIGAVAAEMPITWPDEALKAQAIAAHSYALYCRDHAQDPAAGWLTADPARRQGYLTDAVLRSYWGTAYEANYARLSALVDSVLTQVLYYEDAPAGTSYFAISNGQTEASENVWGTAVPYLIPVDSSTDQNADNYIYTVSFSAAQLQQLLTGLHTLHQRRRAGDTLRAQTHSLPGGQGEWLRQTPDAQLRPLQVDEQLFDPGLAQQRQPVLVCRQRPVGKIHADAGHAGFHHLLQKLYIGTGGADGSVKIHNSSCNSRCTFIVA